MASTEYVDVRKGMVLVGEDGQLYQCLDRDLNTPGNWRAILQLKLKNLKTGSITMNRVRPQDKVEVAYLEKRDFQYLYQEGEFAALTGSASVTFPPTFSSATLNRSASAVMSVVMSASGGYRARTISASAFV